MNGEHENFTDHLFSPCRGSISPRPHMQRLAFNFCFLFFFFSKRTQSKRSFIFSGLTELYVEQTKAVVWPLKAWQWRSFMPFTWRLKCIFIHRFSLHKYHSLFEIVLGYPFKSFTRLLLAGSRHISLHTFPLKTHIGKKWCFEQLHLFHFGG